MTELAVVEQRAAVPFNRDQVDLIKRTVALGATDDELQMFLHQASKTGLDPLARQIVFQKYKERVSIITTIDGYRLTADRTGLYAGNDDYRFNDGLTEFEHIAGGNGDYPVTATATVWKIVASQRVPFSATARWDEYYPGDARGFMWRKMPYLMLGKCAEALALRKAFPMELSGVYTREEMQQVTLDGGDDFTDVSELAKKKKQEHGNGIPENPTPEWAAVQTTKKGRAIGDMSADELQWIIDNPEQANERLVVAATIQIGTLVG